MLVISIEFYIMQVSLLLPSNEFYVTQVSILLPANLDFITRRLPKDFVKGHFFTAKALQNHPRKIKKNDNAVVGSTTTADVGNCGYK